ncbi:MAG: hypothetical protein ACYCTY_13005 [Sulfuricella sp.]
MEIEMTNLQKLLKQQEALAQRIAATRKAEKVQQQKAAIRLADEMGIFSLPLDVLKREFRALIEKTKGANHEAD